MVILPPAHHEWSFCYVSTKWQRWWSCLQWCNWDFWIKTLAHFAEIDINDSNWPRLCLNLWPGTYPQHLFKPSPMWSFLAECHLNTVLRSKTFWKYWGIKVYSDWGFWLTPHWLRRWICISFTEVIDWHPIRWGCWLTSQSNLFCPWTFPQILISHCYSR